MTKVDRKRGLIMALGGGLGSASRSLG
jgi:hypothetical protein